MIITINNDDGTTNFDVNKISDNAVKQESTVGTLQVVIEALDFASRTHRANLEELLKSRDEAVVEPAEETDKESSK